MSEEERGHRNAVFAGGNPNSPIPTFSASERMKAEFGVDIPIESPPLPSGGKVYPVGSALHNRDTIDIRPMTAREEDILTSKALLKKGTVITELIRSCLVDKSVNPVDMLSGDRNALMVAIRATGYGAEYDAEIACSECELKSSQTFNLGQLPIKTLTIEPTSPGMNQFEYVLPRCKKAVKFRFITGRDEEEIMRTQEQQKKTGLSADNAVTTNLFHTITSIDGIEDRNKIRNFVQSMPAADSSALRKFVKDNEPGIIMKQEVTCPGCGHSEEVSLPLGVSFLWPNAVG